MSMGAREFRVARDQRSIENFCEDHISRVVCCHRVAQRPNSLQHVLVLCALDIQCNVVFEGLLASRRADFLEIHEPAQCLRDLDVDQVRSVETLPGNQHPILYLDALGRTKQQLKYGRGINNNQRESRSARKMSVGDALPR